MESMASDNIRTQDAIDTYFELIVSIVKARDIAAKLVQDVIISEDDANRFSNIELQEKSEEEAMRKLLNKLVLDNKGGWERSFLTALKQGEYQYLIKVIDGHVPATQHGVFKQFIILFYNDLANLILPEDFYFDLQETKCLSRDDVAEIRSAEKRSRRIAVFLLLSNMSRKREDWLAHFLYAMKKRMMDTFSHMIETVEPKLEKAEISIKDQLLIFARTQSEGFIDEEMSSTSAEGGEMEYEFFFSEDGDGETSHSKNDLNVWNFDNCTVRARAKSVDRDRGVHLNVPHSGPGYAESTASEMDNAALDDVEPNDLKLYSFQEELTEPCIQGNNRLILAPTNSGKTFVAMGIAKKHLEQNTDKPLNTTSYDNSVQRKVLFLVPKVCLARQQHRQFATYLSEYSSCHMTGRRQASELRVPLSLLIQSHDIVVITAQLLVEALQHEKVKLEQITLLIFDECHTVQGNNPGHNVMKYYLQHKASMPDASRPQIVGLTASVGIGQQKSSQELPAAIDHILKLCANLDSPIHTVRRERKALEEHSKTKIKKPISVTSPVYDTFFEQVRQIMGLIEDRLRLLCGEQSEMTIVQQGERVVALRFPEAGTLQYITHVVTMENTVNDVPNRLGYIACLQYLRIYNEALMLNLDCHAKDSLNYIEKKLDQLQASESAKIDVTERWLFQTFQNYKRSLHANAGHQMNPKLQRMKDIILERLYGKAAARALVFVKTREHTVALERFFKEDFDMIDNKLTVGRFVGGGASVNEAGMTPEQFKKTLDKFREGSIRILVSTSVAEMGIDIPDCSLVINYERRQDEISQVQSEGRARADEAMLVILGHMDSNVIQKDAINAERVKIMHRAIEQIMDMDELTVANMLKRYQKEVIDEAERKRVKDKLMKETKVANIELFKFLCFKCKKLVCNASDVQVVKNAHHVVICPEFKDRVVYKPHKKPCFMSDELYKTHKMYCANCNHDWGIKSTYNGATVPLLKKGNLIIEEASGRKRPLKKWDDVTFPFQCISLEEMEDKCTAVYPITPDGK